ncbi:MAG: DNA polymerase/3'-5' exonuclease PolX [Pelotomaculum sp. PtaB.Bin104]|nr:MAG: DNA polymerase/3'-5' exonuclease PolX [Pelotomaculum sp. PtaB.Bin104]
MSVGQGEFSVKNSEIARIFFELANLLECKGEDFFKIRAYRHAAKVLAGLTEPVVEIHKRGALGEVPGVGKKIAGKIIEILSTGRLKKHDDLLQEIPAGMLEIMALPGIGPKMACMLREKLNISGPADLLAAARSGRVRGLPGMGINREMEIIRNIEMRQSKSGRVLLVTAKELAGEIIDYIKSVPGVTRVEAGGSLRRWQETVGDVDLVASAENSRLVFEAMTGHPRVEKVVEMSGEWARFGTNCGINIDLEVVPEELFSLALHKSTGSKAHYQRLQELFAAKNVQLDPAILENSALTLQEENIYAALGLPYIPPEIREDRCEIEHALENNLPELVELQDIKGDLHVHTDWSDGLGSIEKMVERARAKDYRYIAITDHSQSLKIAGGLSLDRLKVQHREIGRLNEKYKDNTGDFRILTGIEVDILPQGGLDCPDEILADMDLVVASVHSAFRQDRDKMTARIVSAIENKNVDIIGHLTGRIIGRRAEYDLDLERVLEAAARCGKIMEINASPDRLDLNDVNARLAKNKGVKIAVNSDAHNIRRLDEMPFGVAVARRAWLEADDVINTLTLKKLLRKLK